MGYGFSNTSLTAKAGMVDISLKNGGQAPHEFVCNIPGHYGDGMRGQLTVQ